MDLKTQNLIMSAASAYADEGVQILSERLGRPATQQEALIFASALSAMTASWCYSTLHKAAGTKHADAWMHQIFMQLGAGVKGRGTPVTLQINLKSTPTAGGRKDGAIESGESDVELCKCVTDVRGHCRSCFEALITGLSRVVDQCVEAEKLQNATRCTPCMQKLFDSAFSDVIRSKFSGVSPAVRDMITAMAVQMGAAHGVVDTPKVDKALSETPA
jgi:hypothetical protein